MKFALIGQDIPMHLPAMLADLLFAGREAAKMLQAKLSDRYQIRNEPPRYGKDMNDELMHMLQKNRKKERETHVR